MSERRPPFIPAWLDDMDLSQAEFRIYCHLLRRADSKTGIAWPSGKNMAKVCGVSNRTVWRTIKQLEKRDLITRMAKDEFKGSNRYRINLANCDTTAPIGDCPTVTPEHRLSDSQLCQESTANRDTTAPPTVTPEHEEGSPSKVPQRRIPTPDVSSDAESAFLSELWKSTVPKSRNRSKPKKLADEWKRLRPKPDKSEVLRVLRLWAASEDWTKEGGKYAQGIHRWVKDRGWEAEPETMKVEVRV